jgi:hypothetical protein
MCVAELRELRVTYEPPQYSVEHEKFAEPRLY